MAQALLGADHALVAALGASRAAGEQVSVVAAIQAADVVLLYEKVPFALALGVAAGVVQAVLCCRLALLRLRKRDVCREVIIGGRDRLPLAAVQRESRRLRGARRQASLARVLEEVADIADRRRFQPPGAAAVCHVRVLQPVVPQLHEIAGLLLSGGAPVRGVALVERLLIFGDSPLYRTEVEPLRQELVHARYLLAQRNGSLPSPAGQSL
jgi:hypothetical protein